MRALRRALGRPCKRWRKRLRLLVAPSDPNIARRTRTAHALGRPQHTTDPRGLLGYSPSPSAGSRPYQLHRPVARPPHRALSRRGDGDAAHGGGGDACAHGGGGDACAHGGGGDACAQDRPARRAARAARRKRSANSPSLSCGSRRARAATQRTFAVRLGPPVHRMQPLGLGWGRPFCPRTYRAHRTRDRRVPPSPRQCIRASVYGPFES